MQIVIFENQSPHAMKWKKLLWIVPLSLVGVVLLFLAINALRLYYITREIPVGALPANYYFRPGMVFDYSVKSGLRKTNCQMQMAIQNRYWFAGQILMHYTTPDCVDSSLFAQYDGDSDSNGFKISWSHKSYDPNNQGKHSFKIEGVETSCYKIGEEHGAKTVITIKDVRVN
jgi:hypothetical protein